MPRIIVVGDAAVSTGFARCTHSLCDGLHARGWDVHVLGINYHGDPHTHPYPIYPCWSPHDGGRDGFGVGRLPILIDRLRPNAVVFVNDPWNIESYTNALDALYKEIPATPRPKLIGWLAVDGKNQHPVKGLDHIIVWTEFARRELQLGGTTDTPIDVVPLGVDPHFTPRDRTESRTKVCPPGLSPDAFIVGVVGRNQPRKRLDLTLQYFADFSTDKPDTYLYIHSAPTGEHSFNLHSLTRYLGLAGRVILSTPHIGYGELDTNLPYVYSAMDVYFSTSQGEGWGLPALEAMACGVPCVLPAWAAFGAGGWVTPDAAIQVPCFSTAMTAPQNGRLHTVGGIADHETAVEALARLYQSPKLRAAYSLAGRALAGTLSWTTTSDSCCRIIESVVAPC